MLSGNARTPADGLWLLASFVALAVCGLLLNLIIAFLYGSEVLGLFNLSSAVYLCSSQVAVLGQHHAALYLVCVHSEEKKGRHAAAVTLACALAGSLAVIALLYCVRAPLAAAMSAPELQISLLCMLPGLFFFSGDKVLLAILNARNKVAAYAWGSILRYVLLLAGVGLLALFRAPGAYLPAAFSLAELCVFVHLLRIAAPGLAFPGRRGELAVLVRSSFSFGARSLGAGLIEEINPRVNVLLLGLFVPLAQVGIYSFVALVAEGLAQLPLLGRKYNDPLLARLWAGKKTAELMRLIRVSRLLAWLVMSGVCLAAFLALYFLVLLLPGGLEYRAAMPAFAVLLCGITASSGYAPLSGILQQSGYPGLQTSQLALAFLVNLSLCLLLVPFRGILGAAVALAGSQIAGALVLRSMAKKTLHLRL